MIKCSVITVCYNAEQIIKKTIESVLSQTYRDMEFLIMDGASTDNTLSIVDQYSGDERMSVFSEKDSGIYNAMNRGIAQAKGEYIYFLNAGDVFFDKNVLKDIMECISGRFPDIIFCSYIEKKHNALTRIQLASGTDWKAFLQKGTGICHQAILAKADSLKGGFSESYQLAADYDWLCRQINQGCRVECVDTVIAVYDIYGVSGQAKNWFLLREECSRVLADNFPSVKKKTGEEMELQYQLVKSRKIADCLNDLLALKQKNRSVTEYFEIHNIKTIAIYGFSSMGQRLFDELHGSEVQVRYVIDRVCPFHLPNVSFRHLMDVWEPVDAIVITPIFEFVSIRQFIERKLKTTVVSMEDIVDSMYESRQVEYFGK